MFAAALVLIAAAQPSAQDLAHAHAAVAVAVAIEKAKLEQMSAGAAWTWPVLPRKGVAYMPRPFVQPSPITPATTVQPAAATSPRYPVVDRRRQAINIPAPAVSRSGTMRAAGIC